jgi:pyruvate kinase
MLEAGADRFRLNTSHLDLENLEKWLGSYVKFYSKCDLQPKLILDLQGSKWRLGNFKAFRMLEWEELSLKYGLESTGRKVLPVPHKDFFEAAKTSDGKIVLNDAKSILEIISIDEDEIRVKVILGGLISSHKGITFQETHYRREHLSRKDKQIFEMSKDYAYIQYAVSYVKDADEMQRYREEFGDGVYLAAKLERSDALREAAEIAKFADELWICRGDLGAELGLKNMAMALSGFNQKLNAMPVNVIMAGQVLEHMTHNPLPTRSEICYLFDCLERGFAGFVLSDEAAVGKFPLEACKVAAMFK